MAKFRRRESWCAAARMCSGVVRGFLFYLFFFVSQQLRVCMWGVVVRFDGMEGRQTEKDGPRQG